MSNTGTITDAEGIARCPWCVGNELYQQYHDYEWGRPSFDDHHLFELLILESMQSGLSWLTILQKREAFRQALANFEPERLATFTGADLEQLLINSRIIRNRAKLSAAITNAQAFLQVQQQWGSFSDFLWQRVDNKPICNQFASYDQVPAKSQLSEQLAGELKAYGFKFVGPVMCYSYLQAVGLINDHLTTCWVVSSR